MQAEEDGQEKGSGYSITEGWKERVAFNPRGKRGRTLGNEFEKGTWSVRPRGDEQLNIPRWLDGGRRNRSLHSDWTRLFRSPPRSTNLHIEISVLALGEEGGFSDVQCVSRDSHTARVFWIEEKKERKKKGGRKEKKSWKKSLRDYRLILQSNEVIFRKYQDRLKFIIFYPSNQKFKTNTINCN